jgi:hypothetical protein
VVEWKINIAKQEEEDHVQFLERNMAGMSREDTEAAEIH